VENSNTENKNISATHF